jgi:RHS repeat-associated protein
MARVGFVVGGLVAAVVAASLGVPEGIPASAAVALDPHVHDDAPAPDVPARPLGDVPLGVDPADGVTGLPDASVDAGRSPEALLDLGGGWVSVPGVPVQVRDVPADGVRVPEVAVDVSPAAEEAGVASPTPVLVEIAGPPVEERAAGAAPVLAGPVEVRVSYGGFRQAFGGGWADRVAVRSVPACFAERPAAAECAAGEVVASVNDAATGEVSFVVDPVETADLGGSGTQGRAGEASRSGQADAAVGERPAALFAVGGESGNYKSTPTLPSTGWQVGVGSGEFSYAYPFVLPSVLGVAAPGLALNYSSALVDSMSLAENGQASQAGIGWDLDAGYVTRSYASCGEDGRDGMGDLCWRTRGDGELIEDLSIVLGGRSSDLVAVGGTSQYRLKDDPGWRVTLLTKSQDAGAAAQFRAAEAAGQPDNDLEYFRVEAPDGTRYWFGDSPGAESVWTVPVFGDDAGEPCHDAGSVEASWCHQGWRWNLDRMVDAAGNKTVFRYATEQNWYARWAQPDQQTSYDRAGRLSEIRYGVHEDADPELARGIVSVSSKPRCILELDADPAGDCTAAGNGPREDPSLWPDVPADQICDSAGPCLNGSPTFFSTRRYDQVSTQTVSGYGANRAAHPVDVFTMDFSMPDPDGQGPDDPDLWLNGLDRQGVAGGGPATRLPRVTFDGEALQNRVVATGSERTLRKFRIGEIKTETGGLVSVVYGHAQQDATSSPRECTPAYVSGLAKWDSVRECFPQKWTPPGGGERWEWFHKYVVTRIGLGDAGLGFKLGAEFTRAPTALGRLRVYDYDYQGEPAWRHTARLNTPPTDETWNDWRGYENTVVRTRGVDDDQDVVGADVASRRVTRFRGMYGSRVNDNPAATDPETVETTETPIGIPDRNWLQGRTAEEQVSEVDQPGDWITRTYYDYDAFLTAESDIDLTARMVFPTATRTRTFLEGGSTRVRAVDYLVDEGGTDHRGILAGVVREVRDAGDTSRADDTECTSTDYVSDSGRWIRAVDRTRVFAGTCSTGTTAADTRTFYDGSGPGNPTISRGLPTRTDTRTDATTTLTATSTFDKYGRVLSRTGARTGTTTISAYNTGSDPDDLLRKVITTNPAGHTTLTELDVFRGQPERVTDANAKATTMAYDGLGRLVRVRYPRNTADEPPSIEYRYTVVDDDPSRVRVLTQQQGQQVANTYEFLDAWGRTIETQVEQADADPSVGDPGRVVSVTGYDEQGLVSYEMAEVNNSYTPDEDTEVLNPAPGDVLRYLHTHYDAAQRPVTVFEQTRDTVIAETDYEYPGDATRVLPPIDAGRAHGRTVTSTDVRGRVTGVQQYLNRAGTTLDHAATYTHSPLGLLTGISSTLSTGAAPTTWSYDYDWAGRRTRAVDPDTGTTAYGYDADDNLVSVDDAMPAGPVTTGYDNLNRPTQRLDPAGQTLATWTYDTGAANAVGRAVASTARTSLGQFSTAVTGYDADGNVVGVGRSYPQDLLGAGPGSGGTSTVAYDHNNAGQVTSTRYPAEFDLPATMVSNSYTRGGLLDTVTAATGVSSGTPTTLLDASYDNTNRPVTVSSGAVGTGLVRDFLWDRPTGRIEYAASHNGQPATSGAYREYDHYHYRYDKVGNPITILSETAQGAGAWCYTYDGLDRLKTARTRASAWAEGPISCGTAAAPTAATGSNYNLTYSYVRDQITGVTNTSGGTTGGTATVTYTYPAPGAPRPHATTAITATGASNPALPTASTLGYDPAGRVTTLDPTPAGSPITYTYDTLGNLATSTDPTTTVGTVTHAYDPDGLRVARTTATTGVAYLGDTEATRTSTGPGGTRTTTGLRTFTTPGGTPYANQTTTGWTWLAADPQGTLRTTKPDAGTATTNHYYPFGAKATSTAFAPGDRGFLNKTHDPGGDIRLDHRHYTPTLNTLTTPDPILTPTDPQTLNPYAYARNNPITLADPSGLDPNPGLDPEYEGPVGFDRPDTQYPDSEDLALNPGLRSDLCYYNCPNNRGLYGDVTLSDYGAFGSVVEELFVSPVRNCSTDFGFGACGFEIATTLVPPAKLLKGAKYADEILDGAGSVLSHADEAANAGAHALPKALSGGAADTYVYFGSRNGKNVYTGITNNVGRRTSQHGDRFDGLRQITDAPVTRGQARSIEQALIVRNPGFQNVRNSISPNHAYYDDAVSWGESWLKQNGF